MLKDNLNKFDFRGEWFDNNGKKHEGLFYLKDCFIPVKNHFREAINETKN